MSAQKSVVVGATPLPQVNLLPPEIRASRTLRALKRVLGLALVGVVALIVAVYAVVSLQLDGARGELADAQDETARLIAAQQEYAEVPQVLGALEDATTARRLGSSSEILWEPYLTALMTTAPAGVVYTWIDYTGTTPSVALEASTSPLQASSVGTLSFVGRSEKLPDAAAWIESLEGVEGFQDAYVSSVLLGEGSSGSTAGLVYYETTGTVQVSASAFAARFVEEES
ncbi:fimbrial assembly protein [Actinotalea sp.]|uniref:PilN domain-containing protein n=1 Tax=Actinotalea sp. TaxID=1872145 RepID=UPI002B789527|nr:fimbrial assembly protein [Actinotalea sp.]HQY33848.1 fimbrial assembly protein [Actinotalea sp.]HRA50014.1 fimbrial assembly protein [Actinotalea sp.]